MKKFLLTLFIAVSVSTITHAQEKVTDKASQPKSNLETFLDQSGSLIKKEYVTIGKVKGINVQVLKITDLIKNSTVSGLRLEGITTSSYSSDSKIAFLDSDEIENFIKAIDYINSNILNLPAAGSTEVIYSSRGGFSGGAFVDSKNKWSTFMQLEKYDSRSMFFLSAEDFSQMKDLIVQAKAKI
ncbi:hypothetical protein OB13_19750 [Pontibacter sp. HJ8]